MWLVYVKAACHDVRLGTNTRTVSRTRVARVLQIVAARGQGRRVTWRRLRHRWRGLRALFADRERASYPPGRAWDQADAAAGTSQRFKPFGRRSELTQQQRSSLVWTYSLNFG